MPYIDLKSFNKDIPDFVNIQNCTVCGSDLMCFYNQSIEQYKFSCTHNSCEYDITYYDNCGNWANEEYLWVQRFYFYQFNCCLESSLTKQMAQIEIYGSLKNPKSIEIPVPFTYINSENFNSIYEMVKLSVVFG